MPEPSATYSPRSYAGPGTRLRVRGSWRADLQRHSDLAVALLLREIKAQYRRSTIGIGWILLQPLCYILIFTGVRQILNIPSDGIPYILFTIVGLVPWMFFANTVIRITSCILVNAEILKKSDVPRELFPAVTAAAGVVELAFTSVLVASLMLWFRTPVGLPLLLLPVILLMMTAFALGLGLWLAAINTYRSDISLAIPYAMQMWMLASPIFYPISQIPERWQMLYALNPMVGLIEGLRDVLLRNTLPNFGWLGISALAIAVIWATGLPFYRRMSNYFADVL